LARTPHAGASRVCSRTRTRSVFRRAFRKPFRGQGVLRALSAARHSTWHSAYRGLGLLSPTRTYLPIARAVLSSELAPQVTGILHCSGGGQTKCRGFGRGLHYIKDALFPHAAAVSAIQDSGIEQKQMYQVFNMGTAWSCTYARLPRRVSSKPRRASAWPRKSSGGSRQMPAPARTRDHRRKRAKLRVRLKRLAARRRPMTRTRFTYATRKSPSRWRNAARSSQCSKSSPRFQLRRAAGRDHGRPRAGIARSAKSAARVCSSRKSKKRCSERRADSQCTRRKTCHGSRRIAARGLFSGARGRARRAGDAFGRGLRRAAGGSSIGTSSLRRRIQLSALRPNLTFAVLRGNVDTRIRKCREGVVEAIVAGARGHAAPGHRRRSERGAVARTFAACSRAGRAGRRTARGRRRVHALLAPASHLETKIAVLAERGVMRAVEGNCQTPVAAYAVREGSQIWLRALLAEPDGSNLRQNELRAPWLWTTRKPARWVTVGPFATRSRLISSGGMGENSARCEVRCGIWSARSLKARA